jgi:hypothetical protein
VRRVPAAEAELGRPRRDRRRDARAGWLFVGRRGGGVGWGAIWVRDDRLLPSIAVGEERGGENLVRKEDDDAHQTPVARLMGRRTQPSQDHGGVDVFLFFRIGPRRGISVWCIFGLLGCCIKTIRYI